MKSITTVLVLVLILIGAGTAMAQGSSSNEPTSQDNLSKQNTSGPTTIAVEAPGLSHFFAPSVFNTSASVPAQQDPAAKTYVPLTEKQKFHFGLTHAFLTPGAYVGPAVSAYFLERYEVKRPGKTGGDKFADGASKFARYFATNSTAEFLSKGVYPIIFKQDPRYERSDREEFFRRVVHAMSRSFVTKGDNGKMQPNFSRLGGNFTAAALANLYEKNIVRKRDRFGNPTKYRRRVGVAPTVMSFGFATGLDMLSNVLFEEFDVVGKLEKILKH